MKLLILITISIISLNVFSADEVGQVAKTPCPFLDNSNRDAKQVDTVESEVSTEETKVISK